MAGGSQITINDQGITVTTQGRFLVQAGQHQFDYGKKVVSHLPILPMISSGKYNVSVQLIDTDNNPYINCDYWAVSKSGKKFEGKTDNKGYTERIYTEEQEEISFHLLDNHDYPDPVQENSEEKE